MKTPGDKIRENMAATQRDLRQIALGWLAIGIVLGLSLGILLGRWL